MNEMRFSKPIGGREEEPDVAKAMPGKKMGKGKIKIPQNFLKATGIVLAVVIVILGLFMAKDNIAGLFRSKTEVYSAVFLSNGQVYFGKIIKNGETEMVLENVFYIQINNNAAGSETLNQASFNLVKLGNELHGPTDELFINRSQVVFYEKLRGDSKVLETIKNYKK